METAQTNELAELAERSRLFAEVEQVQTNPFWKDIAPICERTRAKIESYVNGSYELTISDRLLIERLYTAILAIKFGRAVMCQIVKEDNN